MVMDRLIDWHFGIDTVSGSWTFTEKSGAFSDAAHNAPLSYYLLSRFLRQDAFKPTDVFYDIGCGDGRVLCHVARKRVSKVVGIELSAAFAKKAQENIQRLRGRISPVEVRCGDAVEMDYVDGTIFFLANPFGPDTLRSVLENIRRSLALNDRPICFIYAYPFHSHVFRSAGWLQDGGKRKDMVSRQEMEIWTYGY
jgi:SAM-dependent methyltransferase